VTKKIGGETFWCCAAHISLRSKRGRSAPSRESGVFKARPGEAVSRRPGTEESDRLPNPHRHLARVAGAHAPSLRRLLRALASYGVLSEAADGHFTLGPLRAALRASAPGSVRALALIWGDEDYWIT
jgi:hypothetical protein